MGRFTTRRAPLDFPDFVAGDFSSPTLGAFFVPPPYPRTVTLFSAHLSSRNSSWAVWVSVRLFHSPLCTSVICTCCLCSLSDAHCGSCCFLKGHYSHVLITPFPALQLWPCTPGLFPQPFLAFPFLVVSPTAAVSTQPDSSTGTVSREVAPVPAGRRRSRAVCSGSACFLPLG